MNLQSIISQNFKNQSNYSHPQSVVTTHSHDQTTAQQVNKILVEHTDNHSVEAVADQPLEMLDLLISRESHPPPIKEQTP